MFAYISSPVGLLKIEQTEEVISAILFTEETGLAPTAALETALLRSCVTQLQEYFAGTRKHFDFPMAQTGTDFQQRVWKNLVTIPFGKTISYNQMAVQLGDAKCIRAAGTANGKNKLSIVVPCHRVIGSNGSLTGYAGGLPRKQWLLEHEAKFAHGVQVLF